jgi:hypothetical protein
MDSARLFQLETTVSRPLSLIHSIDLDCVGVAGGRTAFIGLKIG